jgi:diguanylate cyclase (GGDEF)-like protein
MSERSSSKPGAVGAVCFLGKDPGVAEQLAPLLSRQGLGLHRFTSELELITMPAGAKPCEILVLDMRGAVVDGQLGELIERLKLRFGAAPRLVCIADASDIDARLEALRAGAGAVFPAPVVVAELAERVLQLAGSGGSERYRVLIVDDEPVPALFASRVLERAGMETMTVSDPLKVLAALGSYGPDLVLMDLYMPKASGTELTTLIREHDAFFDTPIIFVSGEKDAEKQVAALNVGGDEFLSKPVDPTRLVKVVSRRVRSARSARAKQGAASVKDDATGLFNRRYCLRRLDRWIAREGGHGAGEGLLFVALDAVPAIRAKLPIASTDALLGQVTGVLLQRAAPEDVATRFGDYSFALIVKRADREALTAFAEQVRQAVSRSPFEVDGVSLRVTASVGVGLFDPPADDALTMVSRAEKACAEASEAGGDRVEIWRSVVPMETGALREQRLVSLIERSLQSTGFELFYQPILTLRRRHAERYESLLRLRAPGGEYIPPFDFIPVAQRHGLMSQIDRWVMIRALEVLALRRLHGRVPELFVHQTMASLADPAWVTWLRDEIGNRDLIKARPILQFELGDVLDHPELARGRFEQLQKLFLSICVTHFDGAPTAFDAVERLRVPMIKLTFQTVTGAEAAELTHLIGRLRAMNATVIAGGIEDAPTVGRLWSCGADLIQGNFIQPPREDLEFDFGA